MTGKKTARRPRGGARPSPPPSRPSCPTWSRGRRARPRTRSASALGDRRLPRFLHSRSRLPLWRDLRSPLAAPQYKISLYAIEGRLIGSIRKARTNLFALNEALPIAVPRLVDGCLKRRTVGEEHRLAVSTFWHSGPPARPASRMRGVRGMYQRRAKIGLVVFAVFRAAEIDGRPRSSPWPATGTGRLPSFLFVRTYPCWVLGDRLPIAQRSTILVINRAERSEHFV
jgi:hypothetical protein